MGAGVLGHEQRSSLLLLFFFFCEFFVRAVLAGNGSRGCERGVKVEEWGAVGGGGPDCPP